MKLSTLVRNKLESKSALDGIDILASYESDSIVFFKIRHRSGRICYTWSNSKLLNTRKLRSLKPDQPSSLLIGSYELITPSCDGVVEETVGAVVSSLKA